MVILGGSRLARSDRCWAPSLYLCSSILLAAFTEHWQFVLGPILVLVVLFARGGLVVGVRRSREGAAAWLSRLLAIEGLTKRFGGLVATDGSRSRSRRRGPRADRPQRRRQDDADRASSPASSRPTRAASCFAGEDITAASTSRAASGAALRARSRSPRSSRIHRARQCRARRAGHARPQLPLLALRARGRARLRGRRAPSLEQVGLAGARGRRRPRTLAWRAAAARDRHRARAAGRACCCSTSPWPAWGPRSRRMVALCSPPQAQVHASCSSSTTWTPCSRSPTASPCWSTAASIASGAPAGDPAPTPRCEPPISARTRHA